MTNGWEVFINSDDEKEKIFLQFWSMVLKAKAKFMIA